VDCTDLICCACSWSRQPAIAPAALTDAEQVENMATRCRAAHQFAWGD
jgi:hypothetical protein